MIGKKINQLATELAPASTDLTIIGNPTTGVSKKITLEQLGAIFSGAVSFYTNLAAFPNPGTINVIYCAKDTKKLYLWSGSAYVEVFPSQALLDTYQLRSEKGVSNGYASLDSGGKVPISQLPSSIMEYKGTWNAATNTPTLANGTGDTGDVYICNVAGTVNFGAGPITFAVGDYVIYSGSIWQRSSGAVGTVTSVGASITGDSITISNSPISTSGTLAFAFAGTSVQYINGAGSLTTFPSLTGFVPYTGATGQVNLGAYDLLVQTLTIGKGNSSLANNTALGYRTLFHITTGNYNTAVGYEAAHNTTTGQYNTALGQSALFTNTTGSQNTAIGLNALLLNTSGGSNVVVGLDALQHNTTGSSNTALGYNAGSHITGGSTPNTTASSSVYIGRDTKAKVDGGANEIVIGYNAIGNGSNTTTFGNTSTTANYFTGSINGGSFVKSGGTSAQFLKADGSVDSSSYITLASLSAGAGISYNNTTGVIASTITQYTDALARASISLTTTGTSGAATYNNTTGVLNVPQYADQFVGTVTSVAALTIGTTGTDLSSTVANGTTTPVITLNVPTASATNRGALSSADWTTFNNKQNTLTNPVTGTGTTNYLPKFTGASTIGNSIVQDSGSLVTIGGSLTVTGNVTIRPTSGYNAYFQTSGTALRINYLNDALSANVSATYRATDFGWQDGSGNGVLTLTASGNLGLGVTPSAWTLRALQIPSGSITGGNSGQGIALVRNAFFDGSWKYVSTQSASFYEQDAGQHKWHQAPSGTAGNAITFTQAMTLDASGNLGLGTTSPSGYGSGYPTMDLRGSVGSGIKIGNATDVALLYANSTATYLRTSSSKDLILGTFDTARLTIAASTGAATFSSDVTVGASSQLYLTSGDLRYSSNAGFGIVSQNGNRLVSIQNGAFGVTGAATISSTVTAGATVNINNVANPTLNFITNSSVTTTMFSIVGAEYVGSAPFNANILRANNSSHIAFETGGSERMRITSGGDVQVTKTTGTLLDIRATSSGGTAELKLNPVNNNNYSIYTSGSTDALQFLRNGSELMRITSGGRLGIGNTSPGALLHVGGTSGNTLPTNAQGIFEFNSNGGIAVSVPTGNAGGIYFPYSTSAYYAGVDRYLTDLRFLNGDAVRLTIASTGAATFSSTIQTAAPTNGTAQPWKLGNAVSGGVTTNHYIIVEINGTTYTINALQGLP